MFDKYYLFETIYVLKSIDKNTSLNALPKTYVCQLKISIRDIACTIIKAVYLYSK